MSGPDCIFCHQHTNDVPRLRARTAFVRRDGFPVATGHLLVIPYRHVESWFDLKDGELLDMHWLAGEVHHGGLVPDVDGWTIGVNEGRAAGRTVDHVHMHLIPRRLGDVEDPRGGVRGVIPGKQRPEPSTGGTPRDYCTQCGKDWTASACGPTHALIAHERATEPPTEQHEGETSL